MNKLHRSPAESTRLLFALLVCAIFAGEVLVMMLVRVLPPLPVWGPALLDAGLLLALVSPLLYFVMFRPLTAEIAAHRARETVLRENEEMFAKVFRSAPVWITITDLADATYVEVNEQALRDTGFSREEAIGRTGVGLCLIQPADHACLVQEIREHGRFAGLEMAFRAKDGRMLHTLMNGEQVMIGGRLCLLTVTVNITGRKRTEEALHESEEKLAMVFHDAPVWIAITDLADATYVEVNDQALRDTGFSRAEVLGRTAVELGWLTAEGRARIVRDIQEHGKITDLEMVFRAKDGRILYGLINGKRMTIGGRPCLLTVTANTTERKRAAEALRANEVRLQTLFDHSPIGIWDEDFSAVQACFDALRATGVTNFRAHFDAHPEDVARCAALIQVREVNQTSVNLLGATTKAELTANLTAYFTTDAWQVFKEELIVLASGGTHFVGEAPTRMSHGGEEKIVELSLTVVPGCERTLSKVLVSCQDITARKVAEAQLRGSQAELAAVYDHAPVIMCLFDENLRIVRLNRAAAELEQCEPAGLLGQHCGDLIGCVHAQDDHDCGRGPACANCVLRLAIRDTLDTGRSHRGVEGQSLVGPRQQQKERHLIMHTARLEIGGRKQVLLCLEDITGRKAVEAALKRADEQFRQAQKMEAIGQLAGGVAHDFNNILSSVMLYLGLFQDESSQGPNVRVMLKDLEKEVQRGANLTRQLLTFSRQQAMEPRVLDFREVVSELVKMLRRLLGEHIALVLRPQPDLPRVEADPGMLEQVVINLCVNARDAMPNGGRLDLHLDAVNLSAEAAAINAEARPGRFLRLSVTDTGCGMDEKVLRHIFEPFFTTKEIGKGTGLGLATVYGIVKQHRGWVEVESKVGHGTTFRVYLPACDAAVDAASKVAEPPSARGRGELVLMVEDEAAVRTVVAAILQRNGYRTMLAADGPEALRLWEKNDGKTDLLLTDMTMPGGMTGLELAGRLREKTPGLKVIVFTGYRPEMFAQQLASSSPVTVLSKPVDAARLLRTVRQCLDGG